MSIAMNYYSVLGIDQNASKEEIKKAYKRLASKHHPDKGGDEAEFKRIQEAYDAITNPSAQQQHADFGDFFSDMFNRQQGNPDALMRVTISLTDAYNGKDLVVNTNTGYEQLSIHAGVRDGTRFRIGGKGMHRLVQYPPGDLIVEINIDMPNDWGRSDDDLFVRTQIDAIDAITGTTIEVTHINGKKYNVKIPGGSQDGQRTRLKGLGMVNPKTQVSGNLYVVVKVSVPTIKDQEIIKLLNTIKETRKRLNGE